MSWIIIFLEALILCLIFGIFVVYFTLKKPLYWFDEFPKSIQNEFLKSHPQFVDMGKNSSQNRKPGKIIFVCICIILLIALIYAAGARSFLLGFIGCYMLCSAVIIFDTLVLDIGIFAHWKKVRLPGTENMDKEYQSNKMHHLKGGLLGMILCIPVSIIVGLVISIL